METTGNKYITPTLQATLIGQINTIREHLNNGDLTAAWFGLKTLYEMGLPDVQKRTEAEYKRITRHLAQETKRFRNPNWLMQEMAQQSAMQHILKEEVEPFFTQMMTALHPYLEKGQSVATGHELT